MEMHGDDWKDEWDDAGRKKGRRFYDIDRWAVLALCIGGIIAVLWLA